MRGQKCGLVKGLLHRGDLRLERSLWFGGRGETAQRQALGDANVIFGDAGDVARS